MLDSIHTIVAGVSHPLKEDLTLVAAGELARWTGARLHLVHAFGVPPVFTPPELGYVDPEWAVRYEDNQRAVLEAAARHVRGAESAVCHTVSGPPAAAILDTAAEVRADLVLVGAARAGRLATAFLGTTAQRVLRGATVPVLVVRRPVHFPLERLLLTTDLSELSAAVHEEAMETVASVFGEPGAARSLLVVAFPLVPPPLPSEALDRAARAELDTFLAARHPRSTAVEPVVRLGVPSDQIASEAETWKADLLVVGAHARGWAVRLALGSVAERAIRDAPCNVLAVPPRESELEHPPVVDASAEPAATASAATA